MRWLFVCDRSFDEYTPLEFATIHQKCNYLFILNKATCSLARTSTFSVQQTYIGDNDGSVNCSVK